VVITPINKNFTLIGVLGQHWPGKKKTYVILKISQINPEVAHPEWIPPKCCKADVQPSLHQRGVHYEKVGISQGIMTVNDRDSKEA
jgi:hypothetical protein